MQIKTSSTNVYPSDMAAAAAGDLDGYRRLRDFAIEQAAGDTYPLLESLIAAECYARFASAIGDADDRKALALILQARSDERETRGYSSEPYLVEVAHHFQLLADAGDADATDQLAKLGIGPVWQADEEVVQGIRNSEAEFSRAAYGNTQALTRLLDVVVSDKTPGTISFGDLVYIEHIARVGSESGDPELLERLATILCLRRKFELHQGTNLGLVDSLGVEAVSIMVDLALRDCGKNNLLNQALPEMTWRDVKFYAAAVPALLAFIAPMGGA